MVAAATSQFDQVVPHHGERCGPEQLRHGGRHGSGHGLEQQGDAEMLDGHGSADRGRRERLWEAACVHVHIHRCMRRKASIMVDEAVWIDARTYVYIYIYTHTRDHVVKLRPRPKAGQRPMASAARHARGQQWQAMLKGKGGQGRGQGVDQCVNTDVSRVDL